MSADFSPGMHIPEVDRNAETAALVNFHVALDVYEDAYKSKLSADGIIGRMTASVRAVRRQRTMDVARRRLEVVHALNRQAVALQREQAAYDAQNVINDEPSLEVES